jgi:branched-chain amino acid transport system ATP-binding protein
LSIEIKDLVCGYQKDIMILHGVSVFVEESKTTSIIGPNGAGKSTLLKAIYGFVKPRRGTVIFGGKNITGMGTHRLPHEGIAYVPQRISIFPRMTVKENLEMGAWIFRQNTKRLEESISRIYERFPILEKREKIEAGRLSGGEQRMLELSRALMIEPKAVLLDEPTAGLAPKVAERIYEKLDEIKEEISILMVDQNVKKALALSDYVYVLKGGRVVGEGSKGKFDERMRSMIRDWLL